MRLKFSKAMGQRGLTTAAIVCAAVVWADGIASAANPPNVIVRKPVRFGVTPPVRDLRPAEKSPGGAVPRKVIPFRPTGRIAPAAAGVDAVDPVVQNVAPEPKTPVPTLSFDGLSSANNEQFQGISVAPPDTVGDVGPNHYVQMVNLLFRVFSKETGQPLTVPLRLSDLFSSVGGACAESDDGDVIVLYDPLADRWILTQFSNIYEGPPFYESIAVSQTGDPTGSYFVYCFEMPNDKFNDYPKFGVWPDAYYMTDVQFAPSFSGIGVFAFDRARMLVGDPDASYVYFDLEDVDASINPLLPADLDGPAPPADTPNYFATIAATEFGDAADSVRIFEFRPDFDTPGNSTFTERADSPLAVASFNPTVSDIEQPSGDGTRLDAISDRPMYRLQYRNFGSHESLVFNHTVNAGSGNAGVRYYELRRALPGGNFAVNEQATFAPDSDSRWMGSAAMDANGNLAVGYSVSGPSTFPSIRYAARMASDPTNGLFQGEASMFVGTGAQTDGLNRWGDYSSLNVDPVDDCTFWYTTEYIPEDGSFNWRTRIGKFSLADCAVAPSVNLVFDSFALSGGNDDEFLDPGECAFFAVTVGNIGTNDATGVSATLTSSTPGITVSQGASSYPDVLAESTAVNDVLFEVCVGSNVTCGSEINFLLSIVSSQGVFSVSFVGEVGATTNLFSVNFESGLGGGVIDNTGNGLWHLSSGRGNQAGHSKTNSIYYGQGESLAGGGTYNTAATNGASVIATPNRGTFTLPNVNLVKVRGRALLTFNHFLDREGASPGNLDVAKVELSRDGGQTFLTVGGPYSSTSKVNTFRRNRFRQESVDLSPFLNYDVTLRFSFNTVDNQLNQFEGWYIDDIVVKSFACDVNALPGTRRIVAQGTQTNDTAVFTVYDGFDGAPLLGQDVLTNAPHGGVQSFPIDTAGNGIESIAFVGLSATDMIDFELRDGASGELLSSGSLGAFLHGPFRALAADVTGGSGQELLIVADGVVGPTLDVRDPATGESLYSTPVLDAAGYSEFTVLAADVDGNGKDDVVVIGRRAADGVLLADVRNGPTGESIAFFLLGKKVAAPFEAAVADLNGDGKEELVVLASGKKGATLAAYDCLAARALFARKVLKNAAENRRLLVGQFLGSGMQVAALGTDPLTGILSVNVASQKGKVERAFAVTAQVGPPYRATAAAINGTGRDSILLAATRAADGVPLLLALDTNTGGSFYFVQPFEGETVGNVELFAADVDGNGTGDAVLSATRTSDSQVLFEVRAGVSGALFSQFNQGPDFTGPNDAFGAKVGE